MSLRFKAIFVVALCLALAFGFTCYLSLRMERASVAGTKAETLGQIGTIVQALIENAAHSAAGRAEVIGEQPWLAEAFRAGDTDRLLKELAPVFEKQKAAYDAKILVFWSPPATAMLRIQDPKRRNDDQSAIRPIVVEANLQGKVQQGIELAVAGIQVRGIAPVRDAKGVIGSVEYAERFESLIQRIGDLTGAKITIMVDNDLWNGVKKFGPPQIQPERDLLIGGHLVLTSTDWDLTQAAITAREVAPARDDRVGAEFYKGTEQGMLSHPLIDFSGKLVGYLVAARDFSALNAQFVDMARQTIVVCMLGFILSLAAAIVVINGLVLRPVGEVGKRLAALAAGDYAKPEVIVRKRDEVGSMFETSETIRQRLADVGEHRS